MAFRLSIGLGLIPRGLPAFGPSDTTPDAFSFTDVTGATLSTIYESNAVVLSGMTAAAIVSISGGSGEYSKNGGAYTATPGTIANGDTVKVRVTSSGSAGATVATTLSIGGVTDDFSVTTAGGGAGQFDFSDPEQSGFIPTI
jgi:hypothetical protein